MIFEWFTFGKGIDWIGKLWSRLWKGRERYHTELEQINNEILADPLDVARYYIEPECQIFPKVEGDAFGRENMINIGGFVCPVIYLSYFTDAKVRLYLEQPNPVCL